VRICEYVRRAGRTTVGVGITAGQYNAAWSFQQRLATPAIPKAQSSGEGCTEVRGHGSVTCVAGKVSEVQFSQRQDSLQVRFGAVVGVLDSGEDLQRCSTSWKDDCRSRQASGKKKIASLASGRTRRSGRFRRNLLNSDADRHGTVRPDALRHGICLPDGAWQGIFVLDARCQGIFLLDTAVSRHFPSARSRVRAFSFWTQPCQGIFLLDAAMSGHFPSGRSRVRTNGIRTTRVMAPWLHWLSRYGTSQQILASHSQTHSGFQA